MKKLAIIVAILLVIPLSAHARMSSMSDDSLGVIKGKVGITIDFTTRLTDSYLAITDSNGATGYTGTGSLTLDGLSISGITGGTSAMSVSNLTLDVGTNGTTTALVIGLPIIEGHVHVEDVRLGAAAGASGDSMGSLTWGRINYDATTCTVRAH